MAREPLGNCEMCRWRRGLCEVRYRRRTSRLALAVVARIWCVTRRGGLRRDTSSDCTDVPSAREHPQPQGEDPHLHHFQRIALFVREYSHVLVVSRMRRRPLKPTYKIVPAQFATPRTVSQTATEATASAVPAASNAIRSTNPSSSR